MAVVEVVEIKLIEEDVDEEHEVAVVVEIA